MKQILILVLSVFGLNIAFASDTSFNLPPVVAKVNGEDIPLSRFWKRIIGVSGDNVLTVLVDEALIEQEGDKVFGLLEKKKSRTAKKVLKEVNKRFKSMKAQFKNKEAFEEHLEDTGLSIDDIKRRLKITYYKEKLLEDKTNVKKEEVKKYFDDNRERLGKSERVSLKHILVGTEKEAKDIVLSLNAGADFDKLAKAKSLDKATRDKGGELGFYTPGMLMPEIQKKAFALPEGGTDIVKTSLGFHVIKVRKKEKAEKAVWNKEMRKNITDAMKQANFNREYPIYVRELRKKSDIEVLLNR